MPSRKKKSKAKGRKPAAGKGVVKVEADGTLNSEMQRLKISKKEAGDEDDVEAMLEQAIKLAAVEQQEMKEKEKENCTHGYNPSSKFQARFCEDFLKTFTESFHSALTLHLSEDDGIYAPLNSVIDAFRTAVTSISATNVSRNKSNFQRVIPCCLAEGTKFILGGKSDDARLCAVLALFTKSIMKGDSIPDRQKIIEVIDGDEHTLVQCFRKQIPCSCLDEKYKQVKSVTKMGICFNGACPLPGRRAVRSKMFRCTGCLNDGHNLSYCSRECQEAHWPVHKECCDKTTQEIVALRYMAECTMGDVQE